MVYPISNIHCCNSFFQENTGNDSQWHKKQIWSFEWQNDVQFCPASVKRKSIVEAWFSNELQRCSQIELHPQCMCQPLQQISSRYQSETQKYAQFHYGGSLSKCIHIILVFLWRIGNSVTTFVVNNTQNYMSWCSFLLLDGLIDSIFTDLQHYQASEFYTCQKIARLSQLQDWFNGSF